MLSHEFKIASRIELQYMPLEEENQNFYLIGHLNLESNPDNSVTRELKTVHLDVTTRLLRVIFYQPYQNKRNIYQQVGLVALQLAGDQLQGYFNSQFMAPPNIQRPTQQSQSNQFMEQLLSDRQRMQDHYEQLDPDVKERLHLIRMELSVVNAPYKEQLRVAERQIQQWAIQLIQLQETKNIAVENEDYLMAKKAKVEFDKVKMHCLSINTKTGQFVSNALPNQASYSQQQPPEVQPAQQFQQQPQRVTKHSEEAVIPALRQGKKALTFDEQLALFDKQISQGLDPKPDANIVGGGQSQAQAFELLPPSVMTQLWSGDWQTREGAIHFVIDNLHQYVKTQQASQTFNYLIAQLINDKSPQVRTATISLINQLMKHDSDFRFQDGVLVIAFVCDQSVENDDLCYQTYMNFFRHFALDLPFTLAILATLDSYLDPNNVQQYKQIQRRLVYILAGTGQWQELISHKQLKNVEYPYEYVFRMLQHTLQHPDSEIRKSSQDILFQIYRRDGFARIEPMMHKLHPEILQTLQRAIPEAASFQGNPDQEVQAEWATAHILLPQQAPLVCRFCGYTDSELVSEEKMDLHYVNNCEALVNCVGCHQMIEKTQYNEHKFEQCERRNLFQECPKCRNAVTQAEYAAHQATEGQCPPVQ